MIVSKEIVEIIKAKCFTQGLNRFDTDEDFRTLSSNVAGETGADPLGVNTWKRIFGALPNRDGSPYKTSKKTANIIADYLGCDSWEQLLENKEYIKNQYRTNNGYSNTSFVVNRENDYVARILNALQPGEVIVVKSNVNKILHLELLRKTNSSCWYKILMTTGSRSLSVGDELEISSIRENYPLHAINLKRNGRNLGEYVAGPRQVVYSVKKLKTQKSPNSIY